MVERLKQKTMEKIRFKISKSENKDYPINVTVLVFSDGKYYSVGIGRFCKTNEEAEKYIDNY